MSELNALQNRHVNHGIRKDEGGHSVWVKTFSTRALGTGIKLPLDRQLIDARICAILSHISRIEPIKILVPDVLLYDAEQHCTHYSYVSYPSLRELRLVDWPSVDHFHELGRLLARAERMSQGDLADLFAGVETAEAEARNIIRDFKMLQGSRGTLDGLALGDVSLSNLSVASDALYIHDFEFAHREAYGYDVGQLLAEINARCAAFGEYPASYSASLLHGYVQTGGDIESAQYWRGAFSLYYSKRYHLVDLE